MALKIRRGTDAERTAGGGVVFAPGELVYVTDTNALYIGDGVTPGGILLADENSGTLSGFISADNNEVKLEKDLNLNGKNLIGTGDINIDGTITATGNINIGDNTTEDTVTITAKVDSDIVPTQDSAYNLGKSDKRWQNVYTTGLNVDGQIDAVSINANTVADNSAVMVNVSTNTFTGNVTGDVTGNLNGNVTGDVTGNLNGNVTGDVTGSVFADNSSILVDGVAGVLRGDHYGNLFGDVKGPSGNTIVNYEDATIEGNLVGNVQGNLSGNVTGNVQGNTAGFHTGDVKGSVFADNSTILVDAVAGIVPGSVISGNITANLIGDVTGNVLGNVTGNVTGNILTNSIASEDSSEILVVAALKTLSDLTVQNDLITNNDINSFGSIKTYNQGQPALTITGNQIVATPGEGGLVLNVEESTFEVLGNTRTGSIDILGNDPREDGNYGIRISTTKNTQPSVEITGFYSGVQSAPTLALARSGAEGDEDEFAALVNGDEISSIQFWGNSNVGLPIFGIPENTLALAANIITSIDGTVSTGIVPGKIDINVTNTSGITSTKFSVGHSKVSSLVPFKFPSLTDAERNALIAEVGMVIFNTTVTKLQVCTEGGGTPTWVDLH